SLLAWRLPPKRPSCIPMATNTRADRLLEIRSAFMAASPGADLARTDPAPPPNRQAQTVPCNSSSQIACMGKPAKLQLASPPRHAQKTLEKWIALHGRAPPWV